MSFSTFMLHYLPLILFVGVFTSQLRLIKAVFDKVYKITVIRYTEERLVKQITGMGGLI